MESISLGVEEAQKDVEMFTLRLSVHQRSEEVEMPSFCTFCLLVCLCACVLVCLCLCACVHTTVRGGSCITTFVSLGMMSFEIGNQANIH